MGKYEVTQGEYLALMGNNPSWFNGVRYDQDPTCNFCFRLVDYGFDLSRPVESVSWFDCVAYCQALTGSVGKVLQKRKGSW
jgi:formylglycine-generating enzyme required for sulfatase activity